MKTVIQGQTINFTVLFYDKEPSQGGVLIDPDNSLHTWRILNERHHHVVSVELFEDGEWPGAQEYFFAIQDDPANSLFEVRVYDTEQARIDAVPGTELCSTGWLNYGVYVQQALNPVASPLFSGSITMTFPEAHNFSWVVTDDLLGYIQSVNLLQAGDWPVATQFWFDITDVGIGYIIDGYDDPMATTAIVSTGILPYGLAVNAPFSDLQSLLYAGDITADYPFPGRHLWLKEGDPDGHISDFTLLKNSIWPSQERYWLSIEDMGNGTDYHVRGYGSDADRLARTNALFESGALLYSLEYTDALLTDLSGEFYLGTVSCLYTGLPHSWIKTGDTNNRISRIDFFYQSSFPPVPQQIYYGRIYDDGLGNLIVKMYLSDADRIADANVISETSNIPYGIYANEPLNPTGFDYDGIIDIDFPGTGAPATEDFEITDSGWGVVYKDFEAFDPNFDPTFHFWQKDNDPLDYTGAFSLLLNGSWPGQATFWLSIEDNGTDYKVVGYLFDVDRASRMNAIFETAPLTYGNPYVAEPFIDLQTLGYAGTINVNYTGPGGALFFDFEETDPHFDGGVLETFSIIQGGGIETFEIEDIGVTQPVYEIWDENNSQSVAETVFPTRVSIGTFETQYAVPDNAVPGENWKIVARGKISGADTFVIIPFRVVNADEALDEAAQLVTLSEAKQFMEIYTDDVDGYLTQLIGAASKTVETFTGTYFHNEEITALLNGEGRNVLHLKNGPAKEILKVEYRLSGSEWSEVPITSFICDSFFVQRIEGGIFDAGIRNWRVQYIAGHDRANQQIRLAVKMLVKFWYQTKDRMGVVSDVVGGGLRVNYQEATEEMPPEIKQILRPYRRLV